LTDTIAASNARWIRVSCALGFYDRNMSGQSSVFLKMGSSSSCSSSDSEESKLRLFGTERMRWLLTVVVTASLVALLIHSASGIAQPGYAALIRRVAPSVVTVLVQAQGEDAGQRAAERAVANADYDANAAMREIMRRLLSGPGGNPGSGEGDSVLGSGFIVTADGLIVTNRHVILGARTVRVRLSDSRELPAQVIGADAATDIALLRVKAGRLTALRLGSSENTSVGDAVIAIGNPFGLGQSVTTGIVSARGRTLEDDPYIDFLQTDAAINRGNSGGPLLSVDGTVVGVTSVIFSPNGGSVGLGFAIPAETVAGVIRELEAHGVVARGYLGASAQALTPAIATALGLKNTDGALITALEPHGPSDGTLRVGDVLLKIGSTPVTFVALPKIVARLAPGSSADVTIVRDGVQQAMPLTFGRLPDPPSDPALTGGQDTWVPNLALGLANTTTEIRKALKADGEAGGLIVTQLRRAGSGALAGLKVGDLITHAGTKRLSDVADLATVSKPSSQMPLLLRIVRDGSPRFVAITGSEQP
jgi:serine protease Do